MIQYNIIRFLLYMQHIKNRLYKLLRKSEKYTKTDMIYLTRGSFWSILAQIVVSIAIFAFAIIVARYLPKDVYGQYKYIIALVAILSTFSLTGLGTSVFQSVARGFDSSLYKGFWTNIRWSALIFLGALALGVYYLFQGNFTLAIGIFIGGSLSPFLTSANMASIFLNAKKDFRRTALYFGITETLFSIGALIITVLLTHNVLILVAVYFLSNTLATLFLYKRVTYIYKPDSTKIDPGMLTYAKHLSLMGILSGVAGRIDQVLLFHFVGPIQLAVYSFAVAIPDQTKGPLKMLNTMIQAKFVTQSDESIRSSMKNKMFWLALSSITFVIIYILIAPYFYGFFFPNYTDAVLYSQIYAVSLIGIIVAPASSYLIAKKKVHEQYANSIVVSIAQIVFMLVGVIIWGFLGLVIARVLVRLSGSAFTYFLFLKSSKVEV